jgi:hypothetical protein
VAENRRAKGPAIQICAWGDAVAAPRDYLAADGASSFPDGRWRYGKFAAFSVAAAELTNAFLSVPLHD